MPSQGLAASLKNIFRSIDLEELLAPSTVSILSTPKGSKIV
jgi:hypothetical protein